MTKTRSESITEKEVKALLEQKIAEAGGVRKLALTSGVDKTSISVSRVGSIRPSVLALFDLEENEPTYRRKA